MRENTYSHFFRADATKSFFEIVPFAFPIGKCLFNFCEYNDANVMTKKLEMYLDIGEALVLSNYILSGRLDRMISDAQKTGKFNGNDVTKYTSYYTIMGGTSYENKPEKLNTVKENFPWLTGEIIAKHFEVQVSTKYKYTLVAKYGEGKKTEEGLFAMQGQAKAYVQIPITQETAIDMAKAIEMNVQAYYNMFYMKFSNKLFPNLECNLFKADSSFKQNNNISNASTSVKQEEKKSENKEKSTIPASAQSEKNKNQSESKNIQKQQNNPTPVSQKPTEQKREILVSVLSDGVLTPYKDNEKKFAIKTKREDGNLLNIIFMEEYYKDCERWEELKKALSSGRKGVRVNMNVIISTDNIAYFKSLPA